MSEFTIATLREQPGLSDAFWPQKQRIWQPYMFEDVYAGPRWRYLLDPFDDCQQYLLNEAGDPIAVAQTIPLSLIHISEPTRPY